MYKFLAVFTALIFSMIMIVPSYAQLGDITASETTTIDVGGLKDGDDMSYTIAAVVPYEKIGGGLQFYLSQQQSNSEVTSENLRARAEGGFEILNTGIDFAGFVELERLLKEGTTTGSVGPFFRFPEYVDGDFTVTSGAGSWLQNASVQAEVGEAESLGAYSVRPFAYASADYKAVNLFAKVSSDYQNFGDIELEIVPSLILNVADNLDVGFLAQYRYGRLNEMGVTSRYSLVARATF